MKEGLDNCVNGVNELEKKLEKVLRGLSLGVTVRYSPPFLGCCLLVLASFVFPLLDCSVRVRRDQELPRLSSESSAHVQTYIDQSE